MGRESLYDQIVQLYKEYRSVNKVTEMLDGAASKIKVQRVLITEGLWSSRTSLEIGALFAQGKTPQEIADTLQLSLKSVQSYLPYTKGVYFDRDTPDAKSSREYKKRNRQAAKAQVHHVAAAAVSASASEPTSKPAYDKFSPPQKLYRLHLELICDLNEREWEILHRFGGVKESLSRDIVVPSDITLHALHYAIQRAFGWQNSHLHHFCLDPGFEWNNIARLTNDSFANWGKLCGLYFRFPVDTSDGYEMDDIYWDEDYDEGMSHKVWLRKKYTGPYRYEGISEHFLAAHTRYKYLLQTNPIVRVIPSFEEYLENKGKEDADKTERVKPIGSLTIREVNRYFDSGVCELLERLRLDEVLTTGQTILASPESVIASAEEIEGAVDEITEKRFATLMSAYLEQEGINRRYRDLLKRKSQKSGRLRKADKAMLERPDPAVRLKAIRKELIRFLNDTDGGRRQPLTNTLYYNYDYGDNWQIAITCPDVYTLKNPRMESSRYGDNGGGWISGPVTDKQFFEEYIVEDQQGKPVTGFIRDQIVKASMKKTVKCLSVDGINLIDDVGGISMFCEFLDEIWNGAPEDAGANLTWAMGLGWSDKVPAPGRVL